MILSKKALIVGIVAAAVIMRKKPFVEVHIHLEGPVTYNSREENTPHNE